jgi:hypothetical protein
VATRGQRAPRHRRYRDREAARTTRARAHRVAVEPADETRKEGARDAWPSDIINNCDHSTRLA